VRAYGVEVVAERIVWQGNHISAAGVSAGIDMALGLTERVHGADLAKALQLAIEYDPQPPFDSGSLEKADAATKRRAIQVLTGGQPRMKVAAQMGRAIMGARIGRVRRAFTGRRGAAAPEQFHQ
jgi:transcriptional regulator GlxA family with amidase domain